MTQRAPTRDDEDRWGRLDDSGVCCARRDAALPPSKRSSERWSEWEGVCNVREGVRKRDQNDMICPLR